MALYGEARDISFFRHINRELMANIISQQCVYYKFDLGETKVNIYGEASGGKYYHPPVLLNCLVERTDQQYPESDLGINFNWNITFKFLRDDLLDRNKDFNKDWQFANTYGANLVPEVGDIIMYNQGYYEVDITNANQYFVGKNPAYDYKDSTGTNILNETDLADFGSSISIICNTHYVPADKLALSPFKERM
jgi:signal peptidase I